MWFRRVRPAAALSLRGDGFPPTQPRRVSGGLVKRATRGAFEAPRLNATHNLRRAGRRHKKYRPVSVAKVCIYNTLNTYYEDTAK